MMLFRVPHLLSRTVLHITFLSVAVVYLATRLNILKFYMVRILNLCSCTSYIINRLVLYK